MVYFFTKCLFFILTTPLWSLQLCLRHFLFQLPNNFLIIHGLVSISFKDRVNSFANIPARRMIFQQGWKKRASIHAYWDMNFLPLWKPISSAACCLASLNFRDLETLVIDVLSAISCFNYFFFQQCLFQQNSYKKPVG